jgi:NADH:ubiquinone oxidoreductase subunit K
MSTESMLKKVELTFVSFSKTALSLEKKVLVMRSMSVISPAGFENRLPRVFQAFHNATSGFTQNLRFLIG